MVMILVNILVALMTMKKSNILVFDEPTNHLDILSKAELWEAIDNFPIDCFINLLEQCKRLDIHPEILEDMDMYIRLIQDFIDTIKSDGYDNRISYYSALNDITNGIDCFNGILSSDIIQDQHLINECQDWLIILLQFLKCPMP